MLKQCVVILKQLGDFITLSLTEVQVIPVAQIHRLCPCKSTLAQGCG